MAKGTDATLNATDSIDGGGGINTLRVFGDKNIENLDNADIKNIQKLEVIAGGDIELDAGVIAGLKSITIDKTQLTATSGALIVTGVRGSVRMSSSLKMIVCPLNSTARFCTRQPQRRRVSKLNRLNLHVMLYFLDCFRELTFYTTSVNSIRFFTMSDLNDRI